MDKDARSHEDLDALAARTTNLIAHLDGALDATMLDAIAGVWSTLEGAATDGPAHARAIRSRLFWQSLEPVDAAARPTSEERVAELVDETAEDAVVLLPIEAPLEAMIEEFNEAWAEAEAEAA